MTYYDRIEATHSRLLASYGQGTLEIGRTETVSDPDDPFAPPTSTVVWYAVKALVQGVAAEYAGGTTIKTTDLSVQCGVPAIVPDVGDPVRVDGGSNAMPIYRGSFRGSYCSFLSPEKFGKK